ncbi:7001_t:CDS:1 [Funneliformis geosporum]|uniref:318_t:CDS:1 n=1 Tax=Funneliformis geosporum TaxID=1117311 RepID=A0A9W4WN15_9GLOM|nr:7001_t:CDS:1 [Funneliformis geosporum]CAI2166134.1 318_t:CDS:1 [Funneliformis geosporum]
MKAFILLAFLAYVLVNVIAVSAVSPIDDDLENDYALEKRNTCVFKRNGVMKRTMSKKCPFTLVNAIFDTKWSKTEKVSDGPVKGLVVFAQDECGRTTVTGYFSHGFDSTKKYKFLIIDNCEDVVRDMTKGLNVKINHDGSVKAFSHTYDDMNLDCNEEGILMTEAESSKSLLKRNCKDLSKRANTDKYLQITEDGNKNSKAKLLSKKK